MKCKWCMFNHDRGRLEKVKQNKSYFSIRKMKPRVKYKQTDAELRLAIKHGFKLLNLDENNSKKIKLTLSVGWAKRACKGIVQEESQLLCLSSDFYTFTDHAMGLPPTFTYKRN